MKIDLAVAKKVLKTVDAGLSSGLGKAIPGEMCVEAAVCYALGLPHGDDPSCVSRAVRSLKITLNDATWSSKKARAKGMRRLALIQLGSAGILNDKEFAARVAELSIRLSVPVALRAAASLHKDVHHKGALLDAALRCEKEGTQESAESAARSAESAARSAWSAESAWSAQSAESAAWSAQSAESAESAESAARSAAQSAWSAAWSAQSAESADKHLEDFAEGVVQILIDMKAPGSKWLFLTEVK